MLRNTHTPDNNRYHHFSWLQIILFNLYFLCDQRITFKISDLFIKNTQISILKLFSFLPTTSFQDLVVSFQDLVISLNAYLNIFGCTWFRHLSISNIMEIPQVNQYVHIKYILFNCIIYHGYLYFNLFNQFRNYGYENYFQFGHFKYFFSCILLYFFLTEKIPKVGYWFKLHIYVTTTAVFRLLS